MKAQEIEILKSVKFMFRMFDKEPDDRLSFYVESLKDLGANRAMNAIKRACQECKFLPKIAEIRELAKADDQDDLLQFQAREQWQEFRTAVISRPNPTFKDPVTAHIAQNVLSIWVLKNGSEKDLVYAEKKFIDAYVSSKGNKSLEEHIMISAPSNKLLAESVRKTLPSPENSFANMILQGKD